MIDELTDEQRAFWDEIGWERTIPTGNPGQTPAQALAFTVHSIRFGFKLDGYPVPSEEAVLTELQSDVL